MRRCKTRSGSRSRRGPRVLRRADRRCRRTAAWLMSGATVGPTRDALGAVRDGRPRRTVLYSQRRDAMKTITTGELKAQCGRPGGPTLVNTLGAEAFEK